jgi:hypothetical protein
MISKYFQRISFISPPRISQILLLIDGGQDIVEFVWIDVLSLLKNFGFDEGHKELPRKSPKGTFSIAKNEACDNVKRLNEIKHFVGSCSFGPSKANEIGCLVKQALAHVLVRYVESVSNVRKLMTLIAKSLGDCRHTAFDGTFGS